VDEGGEDHMEVSQIEAIVSEEEEQRHGEEVALVEVPMWRSWEVLVVLVRLLVVMTVVMNHLDLDVVEVVLEA